MHVKMGGVSGFKKKAKVVATKTCTLTLTLGQKRPSKCVAKRLKMTKEFQNGKKS